MLYTASNPVTLRDFWAGTSAGGTRLDSIDCGGFSPFFSEQHQAAPAFPQEPRALPLLDVPGYMHL